MKEKLSAMLDGNLDDEAAHALFVQLKNDSAFREKWDSYCLLGDIIRGYAPPELEGFTDRVMSRLEHEPTIFIPQGRKDARTAPRRALRRSLLPIAASLMGVLAVGLVAWVLSRGSPDPAESAGTAAAVPPAARPVADGARHEYLVAHQAWAGGPMPTAVQYVRTVSAPAEE